MQIPVFLIGITQNLKRLSASLDFCSRQHFYYYDIALEDKATFSTVRHYYHGLTIRVCYINLHLATPND